MVDSSPQATTPKVDPKILDQIQQTVQLHRQQRQSGGLLTASGGANTTGAIAQDQAEQQTKPMNGYQQNTSQFQPAGKILGSAFHQTIVFHQLESGQYLLSIYPTKQLGYLSLGLAGVIILIAILRRIPPTKPPKKRTYQVRRIEL